MPAHFITPPRPTHFLALTAAKFGSPQNAYPATRSGCNCHPVTRPRSPNQVGPHPIRARAVKPPRLTLSSSNRDTGREAEAILTGTPPTPLGLSCDPPRALARRRAATDSRHQGNSRGCEVVLRPGTERPSHPPPAWPLVHHLGGDCHVTRRGCARR